jgi:hypothetical protein
MPLNYGPSPRVKGTPQTPTASATVTKSPGGRWQYHALRQMNHTAQALMAIRLLQSLPNWDQVAECYGDIEVHLDDLANDLENHDWDDLMST